MSHSSATAPAATQSAAPAPVAVHAAAPAAAQAALPGPSVWEPYVDGQAIQRLPATFAANEISGHEFSRRLWHTWDDVIAASPRRCVVAAVPMKTVLLPMLELGHANTDDEEEDAISRVIKTNTMATAT